jgi:hypothetical protein
MDENSAMLPTELRAQPPTQGLPEISEAKNLRTFAAHDWEDQKENITRLYVEENRTLKEVMSLIKNQYGLRATYVTSHTSAFSCGCHTRILGRTDAFQGADVQKEDRKMGS